MKKMLTIVVILLISFSVPTGAQELKSPVHLRLASQDLGSAWYVYGPNFGKCYRDKGMMK